MNEESDKNTGQRLDEKAAEILHFVLNLATESERSAVILGAARLDVGLERLLKGLMQHHPGGSDNLFDPDRPLGTFSARIALAYRLGLIDRNIEHALQMVRRLRNDFAHSIEKATVSDGPHRNRVAEIVRDCRTWRNWDVAQTLFRKESEVLADFCTGMSALIVAIELYGEFVEVEVSHTVKISRP